jgi:hypothetical protein
VVILCRRCSWELLGVRLAVAPTQECECPWECHLYPYTRGHGQATPDPARAYGLLMERQAKEGIW